MFSGASRYLWKQLENTANTGEAPPDHKGEVCLRTWTSPN